MRLADEILALDDLKHEKVYVPQWKREITVREMTAAERQQFLEIAKDQGEKHRAEAWLVALLCVDDAGEKIFTALDVEALMKKNAKSLDALSKKILELNAIGDDAVEEVKKSSEETTSADSSTNLRLA